MCGIYRNLDHKELAFQTRRLTNSPVYTFCVTLRGDKTADYHCEGSAGCNRRKMHRPGIEPGPPAWQASILPLNHRCLNLTRAASFPAQTPQPPCHDYHVTGILGEKARFCARCQPRPFSSSALRHRQRRTSSYNTSKASVVQW